MASKTRKDKSYRTFGQFAEDVYPKALKTHLDDKKTAYKFGRDAAKRMVRAVLAPAKQG